MNPSTIDSPRAGQQLTFTLTDASGNNVPGTVVMDVTDTIATFTPVATALNTNTSYIATVNTAAASAGGIALTSPVTLELYHQERSVYQPGSGESRNGGHVRYFDEDGHNRCLQIHGEWKRWDESDHWRRSSFDMPGGSDR